MKRILTLDEIMLRLSTIEDSRLEESTRLAGHYDGDEANVHISLANFGHQALFASKIPENAIGKGAKHHLMKYGVETPHLLIGVERLSIYYMEKETEIRYTSFSYFWNYTGTFFKMARLGIASNQESKKTTNYC